MFNTFTRRKRSTNGRWCKWRNRFKSGDPHMQVVLFPDQRLLQMVAWSRTRTMIASCALEVLSGWEDFVCSKPKVFSSNSDHLSYRKLAKRSAFSEETYISFRLPLAVFSTWQSFNRTLSMQLQQRYLSCPLLRVIASVLCGGGQCAVSPGRIGKQKLPPFWKIIV